MKSLKKPWVNALLCTWILLAFCVAGCADIQVGAPDAGEEQPQGAATDIDSGESWLQGTQAADADNETDSVSPEQAVGDTEDILTVTFLDVGQGNSVLVENDGQFMLIDGGDREYSSFVVSYLKQRGVEELAYIVASHYDADHINGVVGALNVFDCDMVLAPDYVTDTRVYQSFCNVISEKDIALAYPAVGETYTFGDAEFTIVCPDRYGYSEANDNSIGLRLVHGENSFLICGDAGVEMEEKMMESGMELDSDVYMASHHGSSGSSSAEFLEAVSPAAVVISVGADNSYGHPTERVLGDIARIGAELYRTDQIGTITVTSDGQEIVISAEREYVWENTEAGASAGGNIGTGTDASSDVTPDDMTELPDEIFYVLNSNTMKFHLPSCSSVADIHVENRIDFIGTREEVLEAGYAPCRRCNP